MIKSKRSTPIPALLALLTILILLTVTPVVQAAEISVGGTCSLADAITSANSDSATGTCTAGSGEDTITLTEDVTLTADLPNITTAMTINGAGFTVDGNAERRIMHVHTSANDVIVTINNITLTNGATNDSTRAAALRYGNGDLRINNSRITNNASGNGCAIFMDGNGADWTGRLTVSDTVFSGNTASAAGAKGSAFCVQGNDTGWTTIATVRSSTIINNGRTGSADGGAIHVWGNKPTLALQRSYVGDNTGTIGAAMYVETRNGNGVSVVSSTFYNNRAVGSGDNQGKYGGIYIRTASGANTEDTNHSFSFVTFGKNRGSTAAAGSQFYVENQGTFTGHSYVVMDDSTRGHDDCALGFNVSLSNIVESHFEDGSCSAAYRGPLYLGSPVSSPRLHVPLLNWSPAIGKVAAGTCDISTLRLDQLDMGRNHGMACDLGAVENPLHKPIAVPKKKEEPTPVPDPTEVPPQPSTCENMDTGVVISGVAGGNAPQCTDGVVANAEIAAAGGYIDAVDIWGWIGAGLEVCFDQPGGLVFLDASTAPRTIYQLASYAGVNGVTCAFIDREGTVVLMQENLISPDWLPAPWEAPEVLAAAPVAEGAAPNSSSSSPYQALSGCMVRTEFVLNFRAEPGGELGVPETVPFNVTLTALERTAGWFHVDYHGARGWISAAHVTPMGTCG